MRGGGGKDGIGYRYCMMDLIDLHPILYVPEFPVLCSWFLKRKKGGGGKKKEETLSAGAGAGYCNLLAHLLACLLAYQSFTYSTYFA